MTSKTHQQGIFFMQNNLTIFVVNFNTSEMTNFCLDQIDKHCNKYNYNIVLLDNSTKEKFKPSKHRNNVEYIDNTNNQIIDYNKFVKESCRGYDVGDYATPKHAFAIDWMIKNCKTKNLLILDSDAFLKKDIDFIDDSYCTIADVGEDFNIPRFLPMIQYINVEEFRKNNLIFCDPERIRFGLNFSHNGWDTGACLYADIIDKKLKYKTIDMNEYVEHVAGGSWKQVCCGYDNIQKLNIEKINEFKEKNNWKNIKIIVCHHKEAPLIEEYKNKDVYINMLGGKSLYKGDNKFLLSLIGDDTGDNISDKNLVFNELTTVYWAWKNYDKIGSPEYIGLNHYRRIFEPNTIKDYFNYDMIIWESILPTQAGNLTMKQQFLDCHHSDTLENLYKYIDEYNPSYEFIKMYFDKKIFHAKNMFIMKKEIFFEFCEMLFPFILDFDKHYPQKYERENSFLSERISSTIFSELIQKYKTKYIKMPQKYV